MKKNNTFETASRAWLTCLLVCFCVVFATGCSTAPSRLDDGYQLGDITGSILDRQAAYCSGTDPAARALLIAVARAKDPAFPVSGLCTDLFTLLVAPNDTPQ